MRNFNQLQMWVCELMLTALLNRIHVSKTEGAIQNGQFRKKMATLGTKTLSKDKQSNNTTYVHTIIHKQTQTT